MLQNQEPAARPKWDKRLGGCFDGRIRPIRIFRVARKIRSKPKATDVKYIRTLSMPLAFSSHPSRRRRVAVRGLSLFLEFGLRLSAD